MVTEVEERVAEPGIEVTESKDPVKGVELDVSITTNELVSEPLALVAEPSLEMLAESVEPI